MPEEKKFYLTKQGLKRLKKEYENLKKVKLNRIKNESPKVLESDDVNPEYLSFHEDLDLIEARMAWLEKVLKDFILIKPPPKSKRNIVDFGAKVLVEAEGQSGEFEIVGSLEANPSAGRISNESPVGAAILGHRIGEKIMISSPIKLIYKIKKIKYALQ